MRWITAALLLAWPLLPIDRSVRDAVQAERRPWLEAPMHAVSDDARPALGAGLVVALLVPAGRAFAIEAALALAPVNVTVETLKRLTDRARPDGAHSRSNAAFPSSHAANAFAVATVLARRWRRTWPAAFALAAIVAYSRLYLDRHWFTDVLAGAALGALLAGLTVELWRRRIARTVGEGTPASATRNDV
jgi:undecaprenyl-diphosphatase